MNPKLAAVRARISGIQPYLGAILWKLSFREVPDEDWRDPLGMICTNAQGGVSIKAELLETASLDRLAGEVVHECLHLLNRHFERRQGREPTVWNFAGDIAINEDVLAIWKDLPGAVRFEMFELEANLTTEEYYEALMKKRLRFRTSCGSCSGHGPHPNEDPPGPLAPDQAELEAACLAVASAIKDHRKAKGWGSVPAGLERWAEATLEPTPVDWRRLLAAAVRGALRRAGAWDYTYARPSARAPRGIVLPSLRAPALSVAIVVDTSGSMGETDLAEALADIRAILKATGVQDVTMLAVDAKVHTKRRVSTVSQAGQALAGGGGTDMGIGIEAARKGERGVRPDAIVVLTDGCTPWPKQGPGIRTVIVVPEGGPETPAWAERVERKIDER